MPLLSRLLKTFASLFANCRFLVCAIFVFPGCALLVRAANVETEPPAVYATELAPLITPVAEILALKTTAAAPSDSGICLLDERLISVDEQGRRTAAYHFAYKTLTEAGIKSNSEDIFAFSHRDQKAVLLLAETIQPDGTHQPVQPNAVLIQSPQRQAQYSLYDDQSELKIIFPNVKTGSITHGIVIIQDTTAKLPGEACYNFVWSSTWATERLKLHCDLPPALAERIRIETLGTGIPKTSKQIAPTGRTSFDWAAEAIRGVHYETERPPGSQIGPAIHFTTIKTWDNIGNWYRKLLEGRTQLSPELSQSVDNWLKGVTARQDQIAILQAHVADDVRYVGLEFGDADMQPHDCNEVWSNRYGDCKDKANLLVAMLRHRGIPASIVLVNTSHLGLVDRRVPDYHVFSHAIVAIPQKNGYQFCDPTIAFSTPGMIGTGSADRDVLVINEKSADWVHTPPASSGSLSYDFDLKMGNTGDLTGWLTLTADGVYGAGERESYTHLDPVETRSRMSRTIRSFYPSAEVIDAVRQESPREKPYAIKAYFSVPGVAREAGSKQSLTFPSGNGLIVYLGDSPERTTTFFLDRDTIKIHAAIAFPSEFHPEQNPADFRLDSNSVAVKAGWTFSPQTARAQMEITTLRSSVSAADFPRFYESLQSLQSWLKRPVLLTASGTVATTPDKPDFEFPLMPTGDGQLNLVDQRFPEDGNPDARRRALERTIQYFPKDKTTVFRSEVRLALLDWNADRNEAAHARLTPLLKTYAGQISPETYAWGESVDGMILRDLKRDPEAFPILDRIARDKQLSSDRRARAGVDAADILRKTSPGAALDLLLEIDALPGGATTGIESSIAHLFLESGKIAELEKHLRDLIATRPDTYEGELMNLLKQTSRWNKTEDGPRVAQLVKLIRTIRPITDETLAKTCDDAANQAALRVAHSAFLTVLSSPLLSGWYRADAPKLSLEDYTREIDKADNAKDSKNAFELCLRSLAQYDTDSDFPERLWRAANYADWVQRQGVTPIKAEVADSLVGLCDFLPVTNSYFYEGRLLRADRLGRSKGQSERIAFIQTMHDSPGLPERFFLHTARLLATDRENQGNFAEALVLYDSIESLIPSYPTAAESALRSVFINLNAGNDDAALHTLAVLQKAPESTLAKAKGRAQIQELLALVRTEKAREVWAANRTWWPQWEHLAKAANVSTQTASTVIPVIEDLKGLGTELGEASRNRDPRTYTELLGRLISAARWLPSLGSEAGSLYSPTDTTIPGQASAYRKLLIALLKSPHPAGIANRADRQLQLAIHGIDGGQPAEALTAIREFKAEQPPEDATARTMRRLHGLAALAAHRECQEAALALEADLANPQLTEQRTGTINILARLYQELKRTDEAERLFKRELANPVIKSDEAAVRKLTAQLNLMIGERDFGKEIETWRRALSLPWYDLAGPQSLNDPRLRNLDEVLSHPDKLFTPAEQVKLNLLAATDRRRTLVQRQTAHRAAIHLLMQLAPTYSRFNQVVESVVYNLDFDHEIRLYTLLMTLIDLCQEGRTEDYQRWRKHPLCEQFNSQATADVALLDRVIAVTGTSGPEILKLSNELTTGELSTFSVLTLDDLFKDLLRLGDMESAEKFVATVPNWKLPSDTEETVQSKLLDYSRRLRIAKEAASVHEQLITVTTAHYPALATELPPAFRDLRMRFEFPIGQPADTLQACLFAIKTRQFHRENFMFWSVLIRSLANTPGLEKFVGELCAKSMAVASTDGLRRDLVEAFVIGVDVDNPPLREQLRQTFAREINPRLHPEAYFKTRLFDIGMADRLGELTDVEHAFSGLPESYARFYANGLKLKSYARNADLPALKSTVDSMETSTLLDLQNIRPALSAFTQLGLKDELTVATDIARTEARKSVVESWATLNPYAVTNALHLAVSLKDASLLPREWVNTLAEQSVDPLIKYRILTTDAFLGKNWAVLEKTCTTALAEYPTYYHFHWLKGVAAASLGHNASAREALVTYVKFSKDEEEYPEAVQLLKKLDAQ